jgi:hypothetical protein
VSEGYLPEGGEAPATDFVFSDDSTLPAGPVFSGILPPDFTPPANFPEGGGGLFLADRELIDAVIEMLSGLS